MVAPASYCTPLFSAGTAGHSNRDYWLAGAWQVWLFSCQYTAGDKPVQLQPCLSICPRLIWHMPNSKAFVAALSSQSGQEEEKAPEGQEVKNIYLPSFLSWNFKVLTFGRYFSIYFHFTSTVLVFFPLKKLSLYKFDSPTKFTGFPRSW